MTCTCGCGQSCRRQFVRGHNVKHPYTNAVPVQRVLPLLEFLIHEHGGHRRAAAACGFAQGLLWKWRTGYHKHISIECAARVVAAVKAREAELRAEARQDAMRVEAHDQHVRRGRLNEDCDACFRVVSEALPDRERVEA